MQMLYLGAGRVCAKSDTIDDKKSALGFRQLGVLRAAPPIDIYEGGCKSTNVCSLGLLVFLTDVSAFEASLVRGSLHDRQIIRIVEFEKGC